MPGRKRTVGDRVGNWAEYDRALVRRGDVTLWLTPDAIATWAAAGVGRRSGQLQYSDLAHRNRPDAQSHLPLTVASDRGLLDIDLRDAGRRSHGTRSHHALATRSASRPRASARPPIPPRSRDAVSISPSRFGAPARAPACTSSLTAPDCPSSAKVSGPRRHMGAEGDAAGGSSISAWTGPV